MDKRAVGKLTAPNHLESFHSTEPADCDKKIISLYTQSSLYSNDFLDMINKSTPYYIDNNSDAWKWQVQVPYIQHRRDHPFLAMLREQGDSPAGIRPDNGLRSAPG